MLSHRPVSVLNVRRIQEARSKKTWMRLGLNHGDTNIENNSVETTWFSEKFKIRNFILIFRVAACTT
jgi:hypothetical protein